MAQNCTLPLPPCQVQNAVFDGMHVYEVQDIEKGQFAAVYATELEENEGLPFWIGKIRSNPESTVDSDDDEDNADGESCNSFVKIEEYNQQPKSKNANLGSMEWYIQTFENSRGEKGRIEDYQGQSSNYDSSYRANSIHLP